jgi:2-polyprenyl-3-methyl-5-hydroxy-6-metoxy-1,4-benzoquinol methylase
MRPDARFWNRIAPKYARSAISDKATYETKLAMTRECFTPSSEVLEVGCGTGSTALLHAPYVRRIHATDFSEGMIAIGKERAAQAGLANLSFEVASVQDLADGQSRYDVVLALNLLHLVDDLDLALRTISSQLKDGGVLVASTGCLMDSMPWLRFVLPPGRWLGLIPRVSFFSEDELLAAFRRAGFSTEQRYLPDGSRTAAVFHIARFTASAAESSPAL